MTIISVAMLAVLGLAAVPSHGQAATKDAVEAARQLFEVGKNAYQNAQYPMAIAAFEEAYAQAPRPSIAFALAQAYRFQYFADSDASKLKRAVRLYRTYQEEDPTGSRRDDAAQHLALLVPLLERIEEEQEREGKGPVGEVHREANRTQLMVASPVEGATVRIDDGEPIVLPALVDVEPGKHALNVEAATYQPEVVETLAVEGRLVAVDVSLEPKPSLLRISAPDGAEIAIDGRVIGRTPLPRPVEVDPGTHHVALTMRGRYPFAKEVVAERGAEASVVAPLEGTTQRFVSYLFMGTGGALFVGSVVAGFAAAGKQTDARLIEDRLDAGMSLSVKEVEHHQSLRSDRSELRASAVGMGVLAAVAGGTGLLLYLLDTPRTPQPTSNPYSVAVAPMVGPGFGGAALGGAF